MQWLLFNYDIFYLIGEGRTPLTACSYDYDEEPDLDKALLCCELGLVTHYNHRNPTVSTPTTDPQITTTQLTVTGVQCACCRAPFSIDIFESSPEACPVCGWNKAASGTDENWYVLVTKA